MTKDRSHEVPAMSAAMDWLHQELGWESSEISSLRQISGSYLWQPEVIAATHGKQTVFLRVDYGVVTGTFPRPHNLRPGAELPPKK